MEAIGKHNPELQLEKKKKWKALEVSHKMLFEFTLQHIQMANGIQMAS